MGEDAEAQRAAVCYHIRDALASHLLHQQAEEDGADRHGELCDEEIEEVEDAHAEDGEAAPRSERQRAGGAGKAGEDTEQNGGAAARHTELLADEGCRDLEHRDAGCQGCHDKEEIEHQRDAVAQPRRGAERLLEDVWQGDEDKRGTGIRTDTHGEGGREDDDSGEQGDKGVYRSDAERVFHDVHLVGEICGVCEQGAYADGESEERLPHGFETYGG